MLTTTANISEIFQVQTKQNNTKNFKSPQNHDILKEIYYVTLGDAQNIRGGFVYSVA